MTKTALSIVRHVLKGVVDKGKTENQFMGLGVIAVSSCHQHDWNYMFTYINSTIKLRPHSGPKNRPFIKWL